jgi:hypothetical protein
MTKVLKPNDYESDSKMLTKIRTNRHVLLFSVASVWYYIDNNMLPAVINRDGEIRQEERYFPQFSPQLTFSSTTPSRSATRMTTTMS